MSNLDPLEIVNRPSTVKEQNTGISTQPNPSFLQDRGENWVAANAYSGYDGGGRSDNPMAVQGSYTSPAVFSIMEELGLKDTGISEYNTMLSSFGNFSGSPDEYINKFNSFLDTSAQAEYEKVKQELTARGISNVTDSQIKNTIASKYGLTAGETNQVKLDPTGIKRLQINADGTVEYIDNTPSKLEQGTKAGIQAGLFSALTMGLGGALTGTLGAVGGKATAAGLMSAAQGGDIKDIAVDAFTAGLSEKVKTLNTAAEAVGATKEVIQQAETFNTIKDVVNLAEAAASGDVLGTVLKGMDLAGLPSVTEMVGDTITDLFPDSEFLASGENLKAVTGGIVKVGTKIAGGDDPAKALAAGIWDYVKNGGELPNVDISLGDYEGWDTPEWMRELDSETLQPIKEAFVAGYQTLNQNVLNPIQELASDTAGVVREVGRDVREFVDPLANDVRQVGRDIRNIDFPDVSLPGFDLPSFNMDPGTGPGQRMASLGNSLLSDEGVTLTDYETLDNNLLQQLRI